MTLPSAGDLALAAARCAKPILMWSLGPDLIVREMAGQLAPPFLRNQGKHLHDILGTDDPLDPSIQAAMLALRGEVVPYAAVGSDGQTWEATCAPILEGRRIVGVIGNAWLAPQQLRPWWQERPVCCYVTETMGGVEAGDLVIIRDKEEARRHSRLPMQTAQMLLAAGVLIPQNPFVSRLSVERRLEARAASQRLARPPLPPLRHLVRLK